MNNLSSLYEIKGRIINYKYTVSLISNTFKLFVVSVLLCCCLSTSCAFTLHLNNSNFFHLFLIYFYLIYICTTNLASFYSCTFIVSHVDEKLTILKFLTDKSDNLVQKAWYIIVTHLWPCSMIGLLSLWHILYSNFIVSIFFDIVYILTMLTSTVIWTLLKPKDEGTKSMEFLNWIFKNGHYMFLI